MLALLLACTPPAPKVSSPLDQAWIGQLVQDPERFATLTQDNRPAWVALHANSWRGAQRDTGPAAERAQNLEADLSIRLAQLQSQGWERTMAAWQTHGTMPKDSALPLFAGLAAMETGSGQRWLAQVSPDADPVVLEAAKFLLAYPTLSERLPLESDNPILVRVDRHIALRAGEQLELPTGPAWQEPLGSGTRSFPDPQLPWTLAQTLSAPQSAEQLQALVFSDCLDASTCGPDALMALGVDPSLGPTDAPEVAREIARALNTALDDWSRGQRNHGSVQAQALLQDLQLVPKLKGQLLLSVADMALDQDHPRQALVLAQLALDLSAPRAIGPVNSPTHFAILAQAQLQAGHTREALDALEVLARTFPQAVGADEIIGDLAVLEGLDRQGDSKEN